MEQLRAKVKGRVRAVGDWVLEAQGWPNQLASSPAPKDMIPSTSAECKQWADKMLTHVAAGQKLVAQKVDSMADMNSYIAQTDHIKDQFSEFVAVLKRLVKPPVKAKSKAKSKANPVA